jgi:hypothetical protein
MENGRGRINFEDTLLIAIAKSLPENTRSGTPGGSRFIPWGMAQRGGSRGLSWGLGLVIVAKVLGAKFVAVSGR